MVEANRLKNIKEYYFSTKLKEIARLKGEGAPIINLGIGSPDLPPSKEVLDELVMQTLEGSHQYQSYWGIDALRLAIVAFYKKHFGVHLEIPNAVPLIGSKEGIMHTSMAFLNKNDTVLIPNPGYPTYRSVSTLVQVKLVEYTLTENENWQPNFQELNHLLLHKPKLMWVNYVHMPTGAIATDETLEKLVSWARKNNIILVNDNPYSLILNERPNSILSFAKMEDQVLELNSLSKSFNIPGWRVGMLTGNAALIKSVMKVKSNMDSGMFYGIQRAAVKALELDNIWFDKLNEVYKKRREIVWQICDKLGLSFQKNDKAGMFVFAKINTTEDDLVFADRVLKESNVFVVPGSIFGSAGKGYIRISLCANEDVLKEVLKRI